MLMAYEATADLPLEDVPVVTPLERCVGKQVSGKKLTLVPILRAGLGMVEGILRLVPTARVGHIGLYRDHDTLEPVDYYFKVPSDAAERDRKSTRLNSSHANISYAVFCLKKKKI